MSHQPITNTLLSQFVLEVLVPTTYPYDKQIITVEARVTGLFNKIEWGDGLTITDQGNGVIRVDAGAGTGTGGGGITDLLVNQAVPDFIFAGGDTITVIHS